MFRKLAVISIVIICLAIAWRYYSSNQNAPRPHRAAPVVLIDIKDSVIQESLEALGTTRAAESVTLTANVTEKISRIHFTQGEQVNRGDVLITLANEEELAQLKVANIELADQKREYKRIENLVKQKSVSALELDRLQSSIDTAQARIAQVQATLKDRIIKAPFDGLLGLRNVSVGTLLKPGDQITTLDAISHLQMDFDLSEIHIPRIKLGQILDAHSAAYPNHVFKGQVISLDSRVNSDTRSIKVRAQIDNQANLLRPGMLLTIDIIDKQRTTIMLPEESVFMRGEQHLVYQVGSDLIAHEKAIKIGVRQNGQVEVLNGLAVGDQIVLQGLLKVKAGAPVAPQQETWRGEQP